MACIANLSGSIPPLPCYTRLHMAGEIEKAGIPFTDIHINLADQTITLKKEEEVVATLVFEGKLPAAGVIFLGSQPQALLDSPFDAEPETSVSPAAPAMTSEA